MNLELFNLLFVPIAGWLWHVHRQMSANAAREAEQELRLKRLEARAESWDAKLDKILDACREISVKMAKLDSDVDHLKQHVYNGKH